MSPLSRYFKGHGGEVMDSIRKAHPGASDKDVKSEFYATANSQPGAKPADDKASKPKRRMTFGQRLAAKD